MARSEAGTAICLEQNDGPAFLPMTTYNHGTVPKWVQEKKKQTCPWSNLTASQRQSPRYISGPCRHQLNQTLQAAMECRLRWVHPWLTLHVRNNPYYPLVFFFYFYFFSFFLHFIYLYTFCNSLKALFTDSINCHTVRIYGKIWNYHCSCKGWRIYLS